MVAHEGEGEVAGESNSPKPDTTPKAGSLLETFERGISLKCLLRGFPAYWYTWRQIVTRRGAFIEEQSSRGKGCWKDPAWFLLYSIFASFVLLIPAASLGDVTIGKWAYIMENALHYTVIGILTHLAIKIVRGSGSLKHTLSTYFYVSGMESVVFIILIYPVFAVAALGGPYVLAYEISQYTIAGVFSVILVCWLARVHKIRRYRVGIGLAILSPVLGLLVFVMPVVTGFVGEWFEKIMSHLF